MKRLFGKINLTWKKLIIFALIAGIYTALMAIIPGLVDTSFGTITETFEVWILFGIIIIMNSKSNKDAALKCFIFFLISQPLVYLLQVPFSWQGWNLFAYYKYWFIWTILCLPMGYIGYEIKKDKWWGLIILVPVLVLLSYSYNTYLSRMLFSFPKYLLINIFCVGTLLLYPLVIFKNKIARIGSLIVSVVLIVGLTISGLLNPPIYKTEILSNNKKNKFDDTYKVSLEDNKYGEVKIIYNKNIEDYMIHAEFKKEGKTKMKLSKPDGTVIEYEVTIKRTSYKVKKIGADN